jgi:2-iminoacetate synthase ThiH
MVALARIGAPNVPVLQIDWQQYGPKLAQVALMFGANDVDHLPPIDDESLGRRRATGEEVRRNIVAAGFTPAGRASLA